MQLFKEPIKYHIQKKPNWCSSQLWENLTNIMHNGKLNFQFQFSRAEKKVMKKRKPIKVSRWAEQHRVLTMSVLPGLWHNKVTPYLTGIMDAAALPFVREITLCKTPQTGGSEAVHNFVGYCIDRSPGPVLYVYPDEKTAKENSQDRVLPMIKASPRLRSYFTGLEKDKSSSRINLQHMIIYFGWGRSVASLANKPIKYAIADEVDKPGFEPGQKETGVIELIDKRLTTFRQVSKFFKISTPTVESGNVWKELNNADIIFDYHVRCPLCNITQLMDFKGIKWEGRSKADPKEIRNKNLAWYECAHCKGVWDDHIRNLAVQNGSWKTREKNISMQTYLETFRPATIGFHIPSWISYFVSLSEIASAFLLGLNDPIKMQDFLNSYCALPWKDLIVKKDENEILAHKNHLPAGIVPKDAVALTMGIDVQLRGFWFVVRAWDKHLNNHLIQYGYVTTWKDVENLVFNTRYQIEGKDPAIKMGIWRAGIDSGGGKAKDDDWSKTEEVYDWVRKNGRGVVFAIKGASHPQVKKVIPRVIDKMSRGNRPIPGGITLFFLDVNKFKDQLHWRLNRTTKETQHITLNADTGIDYARQILAERKEKNRTGKAEWVQTRRDNHLLDCENIAAACADPEWMPSLSFISSKMPEEATDNKPEPQPKPRTASRPAWFNKR